MRPHPWAFKRFHLDLRCSSDVYSSTRFPPCFHVWVHSGLLRSMRSGT